MKMIARLLLIGLASQAITVLAQQAPPTLPERGPMRYALKPSNADTGFELRNFQLAGKGYASVLKHADILAAPEWSPATPLPLNLTDLEQKARLELQKLENNNAEWELSTIQLNKLSRGTKIRWYYALSFTPVLTAPGLPAQSVTILTTLDGHTGRFTRFSSEQKPSE